jgi:hypothetical protein
MISVSQLAASVLFKTLKESEVQAGQSLRLTRGRKGFVLTLDKPVETDRVIKYAGEIVLIVNKDLESKVGEARIDIEETTEGPSLVMRRAGSKNSRQKIEKLPDRLL